MLRRGPVLPSFKTLAVSPVSVLVSTLYGRKANYARMGQVCLQSADICQ
jgi:hypothetical protein